MSAAAIRLFVSDIDGTLVRHDKSLSDANVAAAKRLTAAGIAMSLISSRPPSGMLWIAAKLDLADRSRPFNGGTLFDASGRVLSAARLDEDLAAACIKLFSSRVECWVYAGSRWYVPNGENHHIARERLSAGVEPELRRDFSGHAHRVDKIVGVSDDSAVLDGLEGEARGRFGPRANIVRSQPYYLDVTAPAANKGDGVAAIAAVFGVSLDSVAVAGDMDNDLPMFARAGTSIAMGQASAAVRGAADFVSAANDEDGVAKAIDQRLLPTGEGSTRVEP